MSERSGGRGESQLRPTRIVRDYLRSTKACKLHDFETGTWHTYPTN